jgi:hypothetical protein
MATVIHNPSIKSGSGNKVRIIKRTKVGSINTIPVAIIARA